MSTKTDADRERYIRAAEKMQAGVATLLDVEQDSTPKHLRVGVNSAMVDSSSLAQLLVKKGLITEEEYCEAIADGMEREAELYQKRVHRRYGPGVTLGGTLFRNPDLK